ncbi:MAG: hypothetical protein WCR63_04860 [Bacilli bacterium]
MEQIEKKNHYNSLIIIYGKRLSNKARQDLVDYYSNDLSLSEIAEKRGVSRNAIFMSIHNGEKELDKLEEQIGFLKHLKRESENLASALSENDTVKLKEKLKKMRKDLYYGI